MASICSRCQQLDLKAALSSTTQWSEDLGSLADVLTRSRRCSLCNFLVNYMTTGSEARNLPDRQDKRTCTIGSTDLWQAYLRFCGYHDPFVDQLSGQRRSTRLDFSGLYVYYEPGDDAYPLAPSAKRISPVFDTGRERATQLYSTRILNQEHLDFDLARSWLRLCKDRHGERCSRPSYLDLIPPKSLRLVDVVNRVVVNAPDHAEYAALSYVWGGSQLVASASALSALPWQLPPVHQMPRTVHHAMLITDRLGLRYLWVDSLCIVQDPASNPDKTEQLAQMDRIYAHASLSILASSTTSAHSGIYGVEQRNPRQETLHVNGVHIAISQPTIDEDFDQGVWNTRGWTYQERLLSKRALVLGHHQAYWMCQSDIWCESVLAEPQDNLPLALTRPNPYEGNEPPNRPFSLNLTSYTLYDTHDKNQIDGYVNLTQEYTSRRLGYPSDGVNAITGVFNALALIHKSFFRKVYKGLPEACFDFALLWTAKGLFERPSSWNGQPMVPSWTWAGWFSGVGHGVEWTTSLVWSGKPWMQRGVDWFLVDHHGCSRPIANRETQILGETFTEPAMRCGSIAKGVSPHEPPPVDTSILGQTEYYLHFLTTTTKSFYLGDACHWHSEKVWSESERDSVPPVSSQRATLPYKICRQDGSFCGTIVLSPNDAEHLQAQDQPLDLIFVSYTSVFDFDIWIDRRPTINPSCEWGIANVMWVTRLASGVVERLQMARVLVDAWVAAEPATEWVLLG